MKELELVRLLPRLHDLNSKHSLTRYDIIKQIGFEMRTLSYSKLDECIEMGFLKQVGENPPTFIPDKNKIWDFWKGTPFGETLMKMVEDHEVVF